MKSLRCLFPSLALAGLLALGTEASGQTQAYARKTTTIRAAVLLLDADKKDNTDQYGQTATPFAFYNLDRATGVKPEGWTFVNPYAPGMVTAETVGRYAELNTDLGGAIGTNLPTLGGSISKRNGAYWTVRLSQLNETQMGSYDVLLISPRNQLSLNPSERERLRRFVDGGGVLWVDLGSIPNGGVDLRNNIPFAVNMSPAGSSPEVFQDVSSPLINGIRTLSAGDLSYINPGARSIVPVPAGALEDTSLVGEFLRYRPVVAAVNNRLPVIAQANLGDGTIVVTARGAAAFLSGNNPGFNAPNVALNAGARAAARLATNIVSMGSNYRQPGGGSRKSGSAVTDPSSPVLPRFKAEGTYGPGDVVTGTTLGSPVTYKGFLVATIGNRVVVFDATPGRDLDGDGDEDDGIVNGAGVVQDIWRDTSVGKQMDVIWASRPLAATPLSSPVCAEVPENSLGFVDQILVTDGIGTVHIFQLNQYNGYRLVGGVHNEAPFPGTSGIVRPPRSVNAVYESDPVTGLPRVNPPTVYGGFAYVADATSLGSTPVGRVWMIDLSTGRRVSQSGDPDPADSWYIGGPGVSGSPLPGFTAGATVGYIPIGDNSGGVDRVLYAPGVAGSNNQPGFVSLWLGAKGESPTSFEADGVNLDITTRAGSTTQLPIYFADGASSPAALQMHPRLTILDEFGNPLSNALLATWGFGPPQRGNAEGVIRYQTTKTTADFTAARYTIRIDYSIDWGKDPVNMTSAIERGRLLLPIRKIPMDQSQRILGPIALTTRGTLHMVQGPNSITAPGGSYYAIREDYGRGSFRVVSRFTLYNAYNQTFAAGGQTFPVPPVLEDADQVLQAAQASGAAIPPAILNAQLSGFRYAGGVTVRNGIAYTAINANRGVLPVTMIAAFKAEPETAEIKLGRSLPTNARVTQIDWARSNPAAVVQTPTPSTLSGQSLTIDTDNGIIRLENLATGNPGSRNEITDCISLSQPIGVGGDTRAYQLVYPEQNGGRWSPLLWFGLWNGGTAKNAPLVAGNEAFIAADSILPNLLSSGFTNFSPSAVLWSVDADVPTTGAFATTLPQRNWIVQANQMVATGATIDVSPYYRMPQNRGVTQFQDWVLRLNQTKLGASINAFGVGGGEGIVAAWGNAGLYGLSRADFVVADQGRLLRVDSSGNPISNAFGGRFTGIGNGGGAAELRPLVRPVKAYPIGSSEFLVVDAGGNRVVRMDDDGSELRSIDRITLDPAYKPAAYRANDPLTLKDPRDATTFEGYVYKGATEVVSSQQPVEYWIRYVIADSGNGRIVELADRFNVDARGRIGAPITIPAPDPVTGTPVDTPQVGVLVWQSPSLELTTKTGDYYNSISRVFVGSFGTGRYVYVAGVGRTRPTRSAAGLDNPVALERPSGSSGGAIVVFDPLGGTRVFDRFDLPDLRTTPFLNPATGLFDTNTTASRPPQGDRPFAGISSVTAATTLFTSGTPEAGLRITVSDADAVYEFAIRSSTLADPNLNVSLSTPTWFINETAYTALRPALGYTLNARSFRPVYARRLDSGDIVVVNGYSGLMRDNKTAYTGEVLLLDGTSDYGANKQNLGFGLSSIHFELPPLTGIRGLVSPVFADRR
ncbi:hypothetical protein EON82_04640 [bacterium]|nr:MAG: hypothetical protein EON82_04640 [bacterium]